MPRSRTAWLANFFTYGPSFCYHEGLKNYPRATYLLDDLLVGWDDGTVLGDAEPFMTLIPEVIEHYAKDFTLVYVIKDFTAAKESAKKAYVDYPQVDTDAMVTQSYAGLTRLRASAPGFEVEYESLDDEQVMSKLYAAVLPHTPFPVARYRMLRDLNVTQHFGKVAKQIGMGGNS